MSTENVRSTVERFLGKVNTDDIYAKAVDVQRLEQAATQVIKYYRRDSTFSVTENLLITMIKYAVFKEGERQIRLYDEATALFNMLTLDGAQAKFVSDALFLEGYLQRTGIQIFR